MTRTRTMRWALALGLSGAVTLAMGSMARPAVTGGTLASLVGSGPLQLLSMLGCGVCVGLTIGAVSTGSIVEVLNVPTAWKWIGMCGAACAAALGIR